MLADAPGPPEWTLKMLGTGGDGARHRLGYPSLLLSIGTHRTLIDAGDGTIRQLQLFSTIKRLDLIVLTALSTERVAGLATLLDNATLRSHRIDIVGPAGTRAAIQGLRTFMSDSVRVGDVIEVEDEVLIDGPQWTAVIGVVDDGPLCPSLGVRLIEPDAPGRFDPETAIRMGVKAGPAFAQLRHGFTVAGVRPADVIGPPRPGRKLCVLGPCRPTAAAQYYAADVRLLVAVAPHIEERHEVALEVGAMTGVEAACLAQRANTEVLALVHLDATTQARYARKEAAQFHRQTVLPIDGDRFSIPFSDNGPVDHRSGQAVESGRSKVQK